MRCEEEVWVDPFITDLTGITCEMIENAPHIQDVFPEYLAFIGDDIVVGHNVNFDINFIYDNQVELLGSGFKNDFVDTMRISRRLHPEERHHRLKDLVSRYDISYSEMHRALADCQTTKLCLDVLKKEVLENYPSEEEWFGSLKRKYNNEFSAKDIVGNAERMNPDCPLYGKVCAFTGTLRMPRKEAMQIVADIGGIVADGVTKKTNYLIMGVTDYSRVKGGKSSKRKKAEKLQLEGYDIEVISEDVFYGMIE